MYEAVDGKNLQSDETCATFDMEAHAREFAAALNEGTQHPDAVGWGAAPDDRRSYWFVVLR